MRDNKTQLSRTLIKKEGTFVRVVGLRPVFTGTATIAIPKQPSGDRR